MYFIISFFLCLFYFTSSLENVPKITLYFFLLYSISFKIYPNILYNEIFPLFLFKYLVCIQFFFLFLFHIFFKNVPKRTLYIFLNVVYDQFFKTMYAISFLFSSENTPKCTL